MPAPSPPSDRIGSVAGYILAHPWEVFIERWNWKTAVLSGVFRGIAFVLPMARLMGNEALRSLCIELGFRIAIGGFWGSLLQSFRNAEPAWLARLSVAVALPTLVHLIEYAAFRAGHVTHIRTGMIVSVAISISSLLVNLRFMRDGLLITGGDGESLATDLKRIPAALAAMLRGPSGKRLT